MKKTLQTKFSSRLILAVLFAGMLCVLAAPPAHAQASGTTDVDIILDPLCILYYYSELDVTLDSGALAAFLTDPDAVFDAAANGVDHYLFDTGTSAATAVAGTDFDATFVDPTDPLPTATTAVLLNLLNVWSARCLMEVGDTIEVEVQRGNGVAAPADVTLTSAASGDIVITDTGIRVTGGGAFTAEATGLGIAPTLATPVVGDVQLTIDMSGVTNAGTFSSVAGTDYTVTLTHQ
ncbi:MAG: hypothetical protein GY842_27990 [bacterium]|nr:hypothetical protein [bacterium]